MKTLDEAWAWYMNTRRLVRLMSRVADRYWTDLPWALMEKDEHFKTVERADVIKDAGKVLAEIDDIAVFVIFSVFEAIVRDHVLKEVAAEVIEIKHPALVKAAANFKVGLEEGSFYNNVLDLYKSVDHDLVEQVNQVRQYRNWVAHGRRPERVPTNVTPRVAHDRMQEFLALIRHGPDASP
jgi:hypothetical protein